MDESRANRHVREMEENSSMPRRDRCPDINCRRSQRSPRLGEDDYHRSSIGGAKATRNPPCYRGWVGMTEEVPIRTNHRVPDLFRYNQVY